MPQILAGKEEANNITSGIPVSPTDLNGRFPGDVRNEEVHGNVLTVGVLVHLVAYGLRHHVAVQVGIVLKRKMKVLGHPHTNNYTINVDSPSKNLNKEKKEKGQHSDNSLSKRNYITSELKKKKVDKNDDESAPTKGGK